MVVDKHLFVTFHDSLEKYFELLMKKIGFLTSGSNAVTSKRLVLKLTAMAVTRLLSQSYSTVLNQTTAKYKRRDLSQSFKGIN